MTINEWVNVIPSVMSAIAAVAASYAAFVALSISKRANSISEKSILAVHHHDAVSVLSNSIDKVIKETKNLSEFSYEFWVDWPREIESKDVRCNGGLDPRPLRHVLSNGSEMLINHATRDGKQYRNVKRSMFSIIRDGVNELNEHEYNSLLKKTDRTHANFECALGSPPLNKNIGESDAFRWVCYQLMKRINRDDWSRIWCNAWLAEGWLTRYKTEFSKVKSILEEVVDLLKVEKNKVAHSVLPIHSNSALHKKYEIVLSGLEAILHVCDLESLEPYREWKHDEDIPQLVLYSMTIVYLVTKILDSILLIDEVDI